MKNNNLLILGKVAPPIGGVTIHVSRLCELLSDTSIKYNFVSLNNSIFHILHHIHNHKIIHLHCSNNRFRALLSIYCYIIRRKLIVTFHGNIGRYKYIGNKLDQLSILFAAIPIVLNDKSYDIAKKYNNNTRQITAFIPPQKEEKLPAELSDLLTQIRSKYELICSTNAFNLSYDKNNKEIYGIIDLIKLFNTYDRYCLIISDPSGSYARYVKEHNIEYNANIIFVNYPHSYYELLNRVDCMIRNTTTDGDALSIKEALYLGKLVFATDVVDRHVGVYKYSNILELDLLIKSIKKLAVKEYANLSAKEKLIKLYKECELRF